MTHMGMELQAHCAIKALLVKRFSNRSFCKHRKMTQLSFVLDKAFGKNSLVDRDKL